MNCFTKVANGTTSLGRYPSVRRKDMKSAVSRVLIAGCARPITCNGAAVSLCPLVRR